MTLTRCGQVVKSEILDGDRTDIGGIGKVNQPTDRVTNLRVSAKARPGEIEWDLRWFPGRVASCVNRPTGHMIGV